MQYNHLIGQHVRYTENRTVVEERIAEARPSGPDGSPDQGMIVVTGRGNILDSRTTRYQVVLDLWIVTVDDDTTRIERVGEDPVTDDQYRTVVFIGSEPEARRIYQERTDGTDGTRYGTR